ncbi:MAG TPA: efflux RND transporter periplasmic adaptor subunit [Bacteroidia bacterium]|nr:efflux RND transporter periplasmic adaptor subunit [Bacteroidia bacterium]
MPPRIEGTIVHTTHLSEQVTVPGNVLPWDEAVLMPEVAGRITYLRLPEGQHVTKGTLLVKLYDGDLQAQLKKLQGQLLNAESVVKRQGELVKMNGVSQADYDASVMQLTNVQSDIAAVNAQISKTEILAPFDGVIGLRKVSEGAYVSPGTALATIRSDNEFKLDFSVPEIYASLVNEGMKVSFTSGNDTVQYAAEIIATEQSVDESSLGLNVRAKISGKAKKIVPGSSVTVTLGVGETDHAVVIPSQSIIPQARFKSVIVSRNGKAQYVNVRTGIRTANGVQIVSGLNEGDTIATTGIQFIRPGMPLRFSSIK